MHGVGVCLDKCVFLQLYIHRERERREGEREREEKESAWHGACALTSEV